MSTPDLGTGSGAGDGSVQTLDTNVASQEGYTAPSGSGETEALVSIPTANGVMTAQVQSGMPMGMGMGGMGAMGGMGNGNNEREPQTWLQAPPGTWSDEDDENAEDVPPSVIGRAER